jgi:hypothetical protein
MAAMMKKMSATQPKKTNAKGAKPAKAQTQAQAQAPVKKQEPEVE